MRRSINPFLWFIISVQATSGNINTSLSDQGGFYFWAQFLSSGGKHSVLPGLSHDEFSSIKFIIGTTNFPVKTLKMCHFPGYPICTQNIRILYIVFNCSIFHLKYKMILQCPTSPLKKVRSRECYLIGH